MDVKKKISCEVLVVGGGNAGLVAAIEAKNAGANVLLIEKSSKQFRGGNSRLSGATVRIAMEDKNDYLPLVEGSKLPKEEVEIEPLSKDDYYNMAMRITDGLADKRLTEIYVSRSYEIAMWMKKIGVQWELKLAHAFKKGNHLFWPKETIFLQAEGSGEGLVEQEYGAAEKLGVVISYETAACSIMMNADGGVCGILAKDPQGFIQIAPQNVILACGGFQGNPAWRRRYLGEGWDLVKLRGRRYNTGDGIKMAFDIGAQLAGHWGGCHASVVSEDSPMTEAASVSSERYSYPYSIMVNRNGGRFVDEGENFFDVTYAKTGKEILKQPGSIAFQIFDAKVTPLLKVEYQNAVRAESNSLEELAEELDISMEMFMTTIEEYNKAIVDDKKPFIPYQLDGRRTKGLNPNKTNWARKIDTPPYQAYAVVCGITMTYGGLRTNEKTQVIDTSDHPIKGLYAIGEITGGFFYYNYPGGAGLIRGAIMGRIAGAEAAANL